MTHGNNFSSLPLAKTCHLLIRQSGVFGVCLGGAVC